jgi:hypothetical protein
MNQRFLQHLTFLSFYLAIPLVNAEVFVENMAADIKTEQTRVEGYGSIEFLYPNYRPGDRLIVSVVPEYAGRGEWGIVVIDAANLNRFNQGLPSKYVTQNGPTPIVRFVAQNAGKLYVLIVNKSALAARITYSIHGIRHLTPQEAAPLKADFAARYAAAQAAFTFPGFDIRVVPCGEANAFSSPTITICAELVSQLVNGDYAMALGPIFYHELAHSLLKVWGDSRHSSEEVADELGIVLSLLFDSDTRQNLSTMAAWLSTLDTTNEFLAKVLFGDKHAFSVDRIKKIFSIAPHTVQQEILLRWMKFLVPHMTRRLLMVHSNDPQSPIREDARREMARRGVK